jgi:hypothetical protein
MASSVEDKTIIPSLFQEIVVDGDVVDGEYAYAHVCPECAKRYKLETSDTCVPRPR